MQMWIEISQVQPHNYNNTEDAFDAEKSPFKKEIETKAQENQQNKNAGDSRYQPILSSDNSRISYVPIHADSIVPTNADPLRHKHTRPSVQKS